MALYWPDIKRFVIDLAKKAETWPSLVMIDDHYDLTDEEQNVVRNDFNELLCRLGRHDYEFKVLNSEGIVLECFYCEQQKLCSLRGTRPPVTTDRS